MLGASGVMCSGRSSVMVIDSPRLRKAISCIRRDSVSNDHSVVSKMLPSGQNVMIVPVWSVCSPRISGVTGSLIS